MLIQAQKDMISDIAEQHGADSMRELFKVSLILFDADTANYIVDNYADLYDAEEQEAMQDVVGALNSVMEQLGAIDDEEERVPEGAVVH